MSREKIEEIANLVKQAEEALDKAAQIATEYDFEFVFEPPVGPMVYFGHNRNAWNYSDGSCYGEPSGPVWYSSSEFC